MALSTTKVDVNRTTATVALPTEVISEVIAGTQAASAIMQLSHEVTLPGPGAKVNVITGDPTPAWTTESTEKAVSKPSFTAKTMTPYKLAVIVPFSNEFRRDADGLYNAIIERIPGALAKMFDATAMFGTAPGAGFDTLAGVSKVTLKGAEYAALNTGMVNIEVAGGNANGLIMSPQGYGVLSAATTTNGTPLFADPTRPMGYQVVRTPAAYKTGTPAVLGFMGDWSKALYGIVEDVAVEFSDQATINDGTNQINLWQRNMFAVRCEMEVGFVIPSNDYFVALTDGATA